MPVLCQTHERYGPILPYGPAVLTKDEAERFATKYSRQGSCWIWQGPLDRDGYGSFYFRQKSRRAHRVAWFAIHGDIPADNFINHTCRNRACVNPQHLQVVSPTESAFRDSSSICYVNSQKTVCPNGHPYDRTYQSKRGIVRYCSICNGAKRRRLQAKWAAADTLNV
jgi:hypothetical protein